MSRRILFLAGLSLAAIFLTSFVLLQGRSEYAQPLFPKPWGTSPGSSKSDQSGADGDDSASKSWLPEKLGGLISSPHDSTASDSDKTSEKPDVYSKPDSPALSDPSDTGKSKGGNKALDEAPPSAGDMAQAHKDEEDQSQKDQVTSSFGEDRPKPAVDDEAQSSSEGQLNITIAESGGFHDEVIKVDMVEVGGSHDEVIAALIDSFGSQPNVKLELFQRLQRYGIKDIFDQFTLSRPLPKFTPKASFNATEHQPQILVSTTCELDSAEHRVEWDKLLEKEQTYLFCVVHHADRWGEQTSCAKALNGWVRKGLVSFIGLSKHTQLFLDKELEKWETDGVKAKTIHYVPVFPVELPEKYTSRKEDELGFALQGDFDPNRRDYNKIFSHLGGFLDNATEAGSASDLETLELHLLGHGKKPDVPEELGPHVVFDEGFDYLDFYGILSRTFAILPAFASKEYLDRKASSTVPASLIAGTPLVATQAILDAYTYLTPEAVWFQEEGEEDFDVVGRILSMSPAERKKKKDAVKKANLDRVELNKVLTAEWIREGLATVRALHKPSNSSSEATSDFKLHPGASSEDVSEDGEGVKPLTDDD